MTTKVYKIGKIRQLVDLNGDITNFKCDFEIQSLSKEPIIHAVVVNQTILDSGNPLKYKDVKNGYLSGTISNSNNVYQNYFLVLKSDSICDVQIKTDTKEIEQKIDQVEKFETVKSQKHMHTPGKINWLKIALIIIVIVIGCLILWYFYKKSRMTKNMFAFQSSTNLNSEPSLLPSEPSLLPSETLTVDSSMSLLDRLNNLNI